VDGRAWILTLENTEGAQNARDIHFWGHYPVADLEYETTAPVGVGARIWSPFIPADSLASNVPAAVFEVRMRNNSPATHQVALLFNFPGPTRAEAQIAPDSLREKEFLDWFPVERPVARGLIPPRRQKVQAEGFQGVVRQNHIRLKTIDFTRRHPPYPLSCLGSWFRFFNFLFPLRTSRNWPWRI
jgi:glycosyl hydrolase family 116 (putative beta-glucocerebrosidase)